VLHPFLIKEFDNRWYVIGHSETHEAVRAFGFDRISFPFLVKKAFINVDDSIKRNYLEHVYGVYPLRTSRLEHVHIWADELATHYFQAYPLHESQQIQKRSRGTSIIILQVIPSMELARFILSHGKQLHVQEPEWFRDEIRNLQ
jgi:predicted DNA-binding transcriptional regulator YafY